MIRLSSQQWKRHFLCTCLSVCTLIVASCGSTSVVSEPSEQTEPSIESAVASSKSDEATSVAPETDVSTPEEEPERVVLEENDLAVLIGAEKDTVDKALPHLCELGSFKYWTNDAGKVMAVSSGNPSFRILNLVPCMTDEDTIEALLTDQWAYYGEYIWYAYDDDQEHGYSSGVYEKDNMEYVLTMDMETTDNTIIAMELIDKDLVMEYAKEQGEENKQNTAFAYLHHFE